LINKVTSNKLTRFGKLLAPNILLIRPKSKYNTLSSNSLIFIDETTLMVDIGSQVQSDRLKDLGKLIKINQILFSHYHIDHIIGSHIFPNIEKSIHRYEKIALESLEEYFQYCFQNFGKNHEFREIWNQRLMLFLKEENISTWEEMGLTNVQTLQNNTIFNIGETQLQIIHLPGHSPGHCGLYDSTNQILFIGDLELSSKFGPWYGWPNSDIQAFRNSVNSVIDFVKSHEISRIVSSHSNDISREEGLIQLQSFYGHFDRRKQKIVDYILSHTRGVTLKQIADQSFIYKGKKSNPPFVWEFFELIHVKHHIKELIDNHQFYFEGNLVKGL
jgi:glyoxylase-like metal-dependent hydrolase (beta-lactamase superfamily II)